MSLCGVTGKVCHPTYEQARRHLNEIRAHSRRKKGRERTVYWCYFCEAWHLTKQRMRGRSKRKHNGQ